MAELDAAGIAFRVHEFHHEPGERSFGLAAAAALGVEPERVFKTLVADVVDGPAHAGRPARAGAVAQVVGIVPVVCQLSLRELAAAVGGKRAEMCDPAVAQRVTGYVVGGISPLGQRRRLPTVIDETSGLHDTIFVSGGRRGLDLELAPGDLVAHLGAVVAAIAVW